MLNSVVTGRLTSDALFQDKGETKFITFTVATTNRKKDSVFVSCIRFVNQEPKNINSYKKGALIECVGEIGINTYTNKENVLVSSLQLTVDNSSILLTVGDNTTPQQEG